MKLVAQNGREIFDFGDDDAGFGLVRLLITNAKFQDGISDVIAHNAHVNALLAALDPEIGDGFTVNEDRFDSAEMHDLRRSLMIQAVGRHLAGRLSATERDSLIATTFFPVRLTASQDDQVQRDIADALGAFAAARQASRDD